MLLALGAEFALYRARRYRLTRTVFRGVRFDQHGSAWRYAFYALLWWALVVATLGLAYPWAQARLQRFKLRHTSYGDLPGSFAGSGLELFLRGVPLWLLVAGPLLVALTLGTLIDWDALNTAMTAGDRVTLSRIESGADFHRAIGVAAVACGAAAFAAVLLYPLFQAVMLRWWISGLRFGELKVTSRLRTGLVYRSICVSSSTLFCCCCSRFSPAPPVCLPSPLWWARGTIPNLPNCWRARLRSAFTS